jgi:hypothetical protein
MKRSARQALTAAVAVVAAVGTPAAAAGWRFKPVPIGAGSEYQPPARWPLAGAAGFGGLRGGVHEGQRVHLELFANRRVITRHGARQR